MRREHDRSYDDHYDHAHGENEYGVPSHGEGRAPGKRSLTEGLARSPMAGFRQALPPEWVEATAQRGVDGGGAPLPHLDRIQAAFGRHDVRGIDAHVGGRAGTAARILGAQAYATGGSVAFTGAPDVHTAAHEAAHVVQQRGGVHFKGLAGAGDTWERHADEVADRVVQGRSAEDLLDGAVSAAPSSAAPRGAVQRKIQDEDGNDVDDHVLSRWVNELDVSPDEIVLVGEMVRDGVLRTCENAEDLSNEIEREYTRRSGSSKPGDKKSGSSGQKPADNKQGEKKGDKKKGEKKQGAPSHGVPEPGDKIDVQTPILAQRVSNMARGPLSGQMIVLNVGGGAVLVAHQGIRYQVSATDLAKAGWIFLGAQLLGQATLPARVNRAAPKSKKTGQTRLTAPMHATKDPGFIPEDVGPQHLTMTNAGQQTIGAVRGMLVEEQKQTDDVVTMGVRMGDGSTRDTSAVCCQYCGKWSPVTNMDSDHATAWATVKKLLTAELAKLNDRKSGAAELADLTIWLESQGVDIKSYLRQDDSGQWYPTEDGAQRMYNNTVNLLLTCKPCNQQLKNDGDLKQMVASNPTTSSMAETMPNQVMQRGAAIKQHNATDPVAMDMRDMSRMSFVNSTNSANSTMDFGLAARRGDEQKAGGIQMKTLAVNMIAAAANEAIPEDAEKARRMQQLIMAAIGDASGMVNAGIYASPGDLYQNLVQLAKENQRLRDENQRLRQQQQQQQSFGGSSSTEKKMEDSDTEEEMETGRQSGSNGNGSNGNGSNGNGSNGNGSSGSSEMAM